MMSQVKNMIAAKFVSKGQIVILDTNIRKQSSKDLREFCLPKAPLPSVSTSSNFKGLKVPSPLEIMVT